MTSTNGEAENGDNNYNLGQSDSDEEDEGGAAVAGGSYCQELLGRLFHAAVVMVLMAILSMSLRLRAPTALQVDRWCCRCIRWIKKDNN
jgi:hypothetical protein